MTLSQDHRPLPRRELFFGCGACLVLAVSAGCKGSAPSSCNDTTKLTPEDAAARKALAYVDATPEPGKVCLKCIQYIPAPAADQCAGCKVLKGPIHPNGYCRVYVAA
jgi:hypothetical protein